MTENMNGETIRRWLPAILVAMGLAVSWGSIQTQLDVMADEVSELKSDDRDHDTVDAETAVEIEVLKTNQEVIKEDVEDIKEEQRAFKKETNEKLNQILDELRKQ